MRHGGLQVTSLTTLAHDTDDHRLMVEIACGATLGLVYEGLLKDAIPHLTKDSTVVLIILWRIECDDRVTDGIERGIQRRLDYQVEITKDDVLSRLRLVPFSTADYGYLRACKINFL